MAANRSGWPSTALLAEAREGTSGVLALVGEPGIGKTALLDHAAERAEGMQVLRAAGSSPRPRCPFAGLLELLRPALAALDRIPAPQAAALAGRAGAAAGAPSAIASPSALRRSACSPPSRRRRRWRCSSTTRTWLDGPSAEALLFAVRRLLADPIAVLIAVREGEPSLLDGAGLRVLHLGGLDRASAAQLLGGHVAAEAVQRMHLATAGNPLALLELAPEAERLAALPEGAPVPLSARIAAAFSRRFVQLPSDSRHALLLASVSEDGDLSLLVPAGLDPDALRQAEESGLVTLGEGRVEFVHPLARSAIYAEARPSERRSAHGAIAAVLPDRDVDRRAWHLAAACVGPSAQAATALEHAGERALERSAFGVASSAFERGARVAAGEGVRSRMLLEAAEAAWLAGASRRTLELTEAARAGSPEPWLAARIDGLRGHVAMRLGPVMDGYALAVAAAERVAGAQPEQAVVLLAEAAHACFYAGATEEMVSAGERAVALARQAGSPRAAFFGSMARGMAYVAAGRGDQGAADIRAAIAILEHSDELQDDPRLLAWAAFGPMYLREDCGRELIDRAFNRAREQAAVGALPLLLAYFARDQATSDQWQAAEVSFDEAIRLARETGQRTELVLALAGLAQLDARQGREASCRAHADEAAELSEELSMPYHRAWTLQALGEIELALGRPEAAIPHYQAQAELLERSGIADIDVHPAPELIECQLRMGRPDEASRWAESYFARAEAKGQPWALARGWRCRGLLALEPGELHDAFERALELHALTPDGFESARTRLAYGARLRRGRQRVRAREQLRAAMASFESLGAPIWADQAGAELAASGEKARRRDVSTLDELTPQELHIATLVGNGKTTREAAAAVFLSPKTVEYHLGHVYRKLNIHSREELAQTFSSSTSDGIE